MLRNVKIRAIQKETLCFPLVVIFCNYISEVSKQHLPSTERPAYYQKDAVADKWSELKFIFQMVSQKILHEARGQRQEDKRGERNVTKTTEMEKKAEIKNRTHLWLGLDACDRKTLMERKRKRRCSE